MSDLEVRVVQLEPIRVVSFLGFGSSPEEQAWQMLLRWAGSNGLLDYKKQRFFGFNNPCPAPGSPNYGYEQWMTVGPEARADPAAGAEIKDFPGGLYAIARCKLERITETWNDLARWLESSPYRRAEHQWLEECLTPEVFATESNVDVGSAVFDLYVPVASQ